MLGGAGSGDLDRLSVGRSQTRRLQTHLPGANSPRPWSVSPYSLMLYVDAVAVAAIGSPNHDIAGCARATDEVAPRFEFSFSRSTPMPGPCDSPLMTNGARGTLRLYGRVENHNAARGRTRLRLRTPANVDVSSRTCLQRWT